MVLAPSLVDDPLRAQAIVAWHRRTPVRGAQHTRAPGGLRCSATPLLRRGLPLDAGFVYAPAPVAEIQSIGVFGEEMLLWVCMLRQSPRRPPPDHVFRQANVLLDELKASPAAQLLPVVSADDGMFAIAALCDEVAMSLPDLRPWWSQSMLQARRWTTNNAGEEVFQRLERVRQGPKSVLATYVAVFGCGFLGKYGLPGQDPYFLIQLRAQLARELGVDADRDAMGGVLKPYRYDARPSELLPKEPWFKSIWMGRVTAILALLAGGSALGFWLYGLFA